MQGARLPPPPWRSPRALAFWTRRAARWQGRARDKTRPMHGPAYRPGRMAVGDRGLRLALRAWALRRRCLVAGVADPFAQAPLALVRRALPGAALVIGDTDRE